MPGTKDPTTVALPAGLHSLHPREEQNTCPRPFAARPGSRNPRIVSCVGEGESSSARLEPRMSAARTDIRYVTRG